jgi:serine/threonine protein phosphatase PrpC
MGLAILADGMGGYNAGEVASGMATTLLGTELEKAFQKTAPHRRRPPASCTPMSCSRPRSPSANTAIYQAAQSQPQYAGMGTTLVVGAVLRQHDDRCPHRRFRLYRLRGERVPGRSPAITPCCRSRSTAA